MTKKVISLLLVLAVLFSMVGAAFVTEASAATIDSSEMMVADWLFGDTLYERGAADVMKEYSELGITDVFLLVKGLSGKLSWQSKISGTTMVYTSTDLLKQACDAAKPYGIRVHAWIAAAQDNLYAKNNQDAVAYHFRAGTALDDVTVNLDMRHSEYRAYVRSLIKELNGYDIAGIHFDYIRYSTLFYDWCASMRNSLINDYGITKAEYNAAVKAMCQQANEDYGASYKYTTNSDGYYVYSSSGTSPSGATFAECLLGQGTTDGNNGCQKVAKMRKDLVKNFISEVTKDLDDDKLISCAIMPEAVYDVFGSAAYCQDPEVLKDVIDFAAIMSYSSEYGYASDDAWIARLAETCAKDGLDAVAAIQTFDSEVGNSNPTCANIYNQYYNVLAKKKTVNADSSSANILGVAFFRAAKMTLASAYVKNSTTMNIKVHQQDEVGNGITKLVFEAKNGVTISKVSNKSGWASGTSFTISTDKKSLTIANSSVDLKNYGSASFDITYSGTVSADTGAFYLRAYNHNSTMDYGFCTTLFPAHEHSYTSKVTTAATCTANGVKTYTCSCGDKYTEAISAIGHSYDSGVVTTEPSCVSEGIKTFTCANCGDQYTENIATTGGHNYQISAVIQEATCQQNGKVTYTCSGCNDSYTTITTKAAHDFDSIYDDVTESIIDVCTVCGYISDVTCAEHHAKVETWSASSTTHEVFCYNCNAYIKSVDCVFEVIERVDPTCTTDGYELYACNGHYDLTSLILTNDMTTNAGCENSYTVTLPAACTYVYTSNSGATHTGKCTACGKTTDREACQLVNGVCSLCNYRPQNFINLHFDSNSVANSTSSWTLNKDVSFSINTATSSLSGTATGADPYIGMPATGSLLNYTVQENDIVEIRMKSSINTGSAEDIQLFYSTTATKAYSDANSVHFAPKDLDSGVYEVYQASFDPSVIGKTINALRIDPYDLASNSLNANFEIDYIYVGPATHAPSKQAKMLYFGFTNNAEAVARYSNSVYEGYNFDLLPWATNYTRNSATFSYADEGNLVLGDLQDTTDVYAQTATTVCDLAQTPLEYTVGSNDVVVIRYKTENITATPDSYVRLYYGVDNDPTVGSNSYISLPGNVSSSANGNYVVVSARLSKLAGTLISSVRPHFGGIADDGTGKGKISIDYIYVGPAENNPADKAGALYFDFGNTSADQLRYDAYTYGYYNYDVGGWHATSSRNSLPVYNSDAGTMTTIVVGENPYLQITGAEAMFSNHPLNFDPSAAEMAEIRLKLSNLTLINEGIPAKVVLKFMLDDDDVSTGSIYFTQELDAADLTSSEYVTLTFPVRDFFDGVEKVTTIYTSVQGVKPVSDNVASICYDYIYVGPRNKDAYFVYFTDESGNNIITYEVSDAENPISYHGIVPMKEGNNWIHYEFAGWGDADGNIMDLSSEIFFEDITLRAVFTEVAHEYEFTYTDSIHSGVCSCGAPYVEEAHDWDEGTITKKVSCTEDGVLTYACFCGASYTETIPATGHNHVTNTIAPTCTERGYVLHVCVCGNNYKSDYVDALGHAYVYTANADDTHTITCSNNNCGYNLTESHDWDDGQVLSNQSCVSDGSTLFTCGTCHLEMTETYEATGHKVVCVEAKAATCTEAGNSLYYKCENCGNSYLDAGCVYVAPESYFQLPSTGHNYTASTVAPTCTTGGYTEHVCGNCGDSYKTDESDALGHSHGTPVDNGDGTHTATCSCGDAISDSHNFVDGSCICGAVEVTGPALDANISIGETLSLESDLTMNLRIKTSQLKAYDLSTAYLVVERDIYNSDGTMEVETRTLTDYTIKDNRLVFAYTGISAAQMNDQIRAVLYVKDASGKEYMSNQKITSVAIYSDLMLGASAGNQKLITLIIDMLNYGTAAQIYYNRHADAPVNQAFESFKTYASYASTDLSSALEDLSSQLPTAGATAAISQGLDLSTKVGITYKVKLPTGVNAANATLVIKDADGNELEIFDLSTGTVDSKGRYCVTFFGSTSRDMRRVVYATVVVNGQAISNTYTYSISSYAHTIANTAGMPESLVDLTKLMVVYGDSAVAYFG